MILGPHLSRLYQINTTQNVNLKEEVGSFYQEFSQPPLPASTKNRF